MFKKLQSSIVLVGLALAALVSPIKEANAASLVNASFINGQNIVITNNTTINFTSTNYYLVGLNGTNVQALGTNVTGQFLNQPGLVDVDYWADANGNVNTNANISITVGSSNFVQRAYQNIPVSLQAVPMVPITSASTNTMTFTFVRAGDGTNFGTSAQDQFVVLFGASATAAVTIVTNLPPNFLTGTAKIRLSSIVASSASTSPGIYVSSVKLNGYRP